MPTQSNQLATPATPSISAWVSSDVLRTKFAAAMSQMYREEVPQYGSLIALVAATNAQVLAQDPALADHMRASGDLARLDVERHGAIRVGTAQELSTLRHVFAIMGMEPVGYYDLSVAGVPVHSTAFRPVTDEALQANPFRVFTSLLRLELIADPALRGQAQRILAQRQIFTPQLLALLQVHQTQGGLHAEQADEFVQQALQTFRWHSQATVDAATYDALQGQHRLIADVVCFKGPHINHLTPRTLDIDAAQAAMPAHGMDAKEVVEGPPKRQCPILLRQTSFKALREPIQFVGASSNDQGAHTARFGEIEQRGVALTRKGRRLYDQLLAQVRDMGQAGNAAPDYAMRLEQAFAQFPDDHVLMHQQGLAFYRYSLTEAGKVQAVQWAAASAPDWNAAIAQGWVRIEPIIYEDFLPVSAAGIFQSNLGGQEQKSYAEQAAQAQLEAALGTAVHDEIALYAQAQARSQAQVLHTLQATVAA